MLVLRGGRLVVEPARMAEKRKGGGPRSRFAWSATDDRLKRLLRAEASVGQLMVEG